MKSKLPRINELFIMGHVTAAYNNNWLIIFRHRTVVITLGDYDITLSVGGVFRRDASICIARISYGNVAGWLGGCLSQPVLYQND